MQQTAFNLIAIGIFVMTLSVLLGPLLNISPVIPAVATLGILSLFTLDTLSWQGKGVTLLLDSLSSSQHRERVVRHEAGHFLVAYFLGIPVTGYTLTAWEALKQGYPGASGVRFDTDALSEKGNANGEMRLILDRFCTVWMAGIAAETLVYGNTEGGAEDKQKIRDALIPLGHSERECQQKQRWAQLQATTLLEKYQASYESLVNAMEQRASVTQCCQIIQDRVES